MERLSLVEKSPYYWEEEPIIEKKQQNKLSNKYRLIDLCCGAGGLSAGFELTNLFEVVLGLDIYTSAMETFRHNHPFSSTILGDIRKITDKMFLDTIGNMQVNVVAAGVPCQGFSISNKKRNAYDERNFMFLEVIRLANNVEPDIILIENVSGMKSTGQGSFVKNIEQALSNVGTGYNVTHGMVNAVDFGVPQYRKRLIFIGLKKKLNINEFLFPNPTHGNGLPLKHTTVWDAISDLPFILSGESANEYRSNPNSKYQELMRERSQGLFNYQAPNHPQATIKRIEQTIPGQPMYENYKQRIRLSWDTQSPTQLAGGIRSQFQFGHPEVPRGLTIRERARIQSFPDDYIFKGGIVQGRVQTGNAVPPLLAKAIAFQLGQVLTGAGVG
ncbi:MAG: hypothetical protein APF76_00160 [Desulfitibacter sp. BRH_c19]|nr:MAG: hypothetical protein APF76_00160 [Desulfitibacter sp. BRH_c19]